MTGVETVTELRRMPSPAPEPQSLAFDGTRLWMGSRATRRLYAIDPATWAARDEGEAPDTPWGMTVVGDELRVIHSHGPDDDRVVSRFIPGHGFTSAGAFDAPEHTGSQLSWDGDVLYISQWYNRRLLGVDRTGAILSTIEAPHGICGQVVVDGRFYLLTTDDEDAGDYWITRIDARGAAPVVDDIAVVPFRARALAFDGERFWTNHREAHEIVAFARPDA